MFKTALRISVLLFIAAASFYCGRASKYAQSEPVAAENVAIDDNTKYFTLSDLPNTPASNSNIEFQLQNKLPIYDPVKGEFILDSTQAEKISIPNNPNIHYYPSRNEEATPKNYDRKKIERNHDAELLNKWCQTLCQQKPGQCNYDLRYPLAWNENGYTFRGEQLGQIQPVQPVKEIFNFCTSFPR